MTILGTTISRERFVFICLLFLMSVLLIAARSYYVQRLPPWVYILDGCLLGAAIVVSVIDSRKSKDKSTSVEKM